MIKIAIRASPKPQMNFLYSTLREYELLVQKLRRITYKISILTTTATGHVEFTGENVASSTFNLPLAYK
jgi:hypothetical protein